MDQVSMPEVVRRYLTDFMIGRKFENWVIEEVIGSGNTAITYRITDAYDLPYALKVVTRESYEEAPFQEIARFTGAQDERYLVFPKETGIWEAMVGGQQYQFVWFKSRCVSGQTLRSFLDGRTVIPTQEIVDFIHHMTFALEELGRIGFSHGDLHDRNIMREVVGANGPSPEIRYVVIDFSEAHPIESAHEGLLRDISCFGQHLRSFYDVVSQRPALTREDERILAAISHIPGLLMGSGTESLAVARPMQVLERFRDAIRSTEKVPARLKTPFDSLSAEYIGDESLLAALCYTESPWADSLTDNSNVLLIGPRGCGKTMLFKRLRLKTKIAASRATELDEDAYVGFYLPCESLFFMRFSDLSDVAVRDNASALILFFNMAVLAEVASALHLLPPSMGPVSPTLTASVMKLFRDENDAWWDSLSLQATMNDLEAVRGAAEYVMVQIRKHIAYCKPVPARGSADFLSRLVSLVKSEVPRLASRYFIFFLDDYTEERVSWVLQKVLHPIVCQRSEDLCFKMSAHMFGSIYNQPRPLALDEGRNIMIINLGTAYLNYRKRQDGRLLLTILDERFKHCDDYDGGIEDWLGNTTYPGGKTLSLALRDERETKLPAYYHGVRCLMDLCTGDYSEMIRTVGEIFREAGVGAGSPVERIPASTQHQAIRKVSREYLGRTRLISPDGQELFEVVDAFGALSHHLLTIAPLVRQGQNRSGDPRREPTCQLNVYVDELMRASEAARRRWERLQRASIFMDVGLAPSQRAVIADRATLRRIYCPAFKTTLTSSENFQLKAGEFEYFMSKPREFCQRKLKTAIRRGRTVIPNQIGLDDEMQEETPIIPRELDPDDMQEETSIIPNEPDPAHLVDFTSQGPDAWKQSVRALPQLEPVEEVIRPEESFDIYIGAFGFEDRTTSAIDALVRHGVYARNALLLEFDTYYAENDTHRDRYESLIKQLTKGLPHRPVHAPVSSLDSQFPQRLLGLLRVSAKNGTPAVLFDCTSCPSVIHSQVLRVLFDQGCDLTILYSEASGYGPTQSEWDSGLVAPRGSKVLGPVSGFHCAAKPPILQADDIGEYPVVLALFPTFTTERTAGILADVDPSARIWMFGKPPHLDNAFRLEMAKAFAAPIMNPGDIWTVIGTFDYRETLVAMGGIYHRYHERNRIVVMPHGSKMQTLGANLFSAVHPISMVFAMPKNYDPKTYSSGCRQVWSIRLGGTTELCKQLRAARFR